MGPVCIARHSARKSWLVAGAWSVPLFPDVFLHGLGRELHRWHLGRNDQSCLGCRLDLLDSDTWRQLLEEKAVVGRLYHRELGDDEAHLSVRGQRQRAFLD